MPKRAITIADAKGRFLVDKDFLAKRYGVSRRTIEFWVAGKKIPYVKIGGAIRFAVEAVDRAIVKRFGVQEIVFKG